VLHVAKSTWHYSQVKQSYEDKYEYMRAPLLEIARQHPEYGYRRTTSELGERGYRHNRKVIQRLHQCWDLSIGRRIKKPGVNPVQAIVRAAGPQVNLVAGREDIGPLEVLYTDFTEIRYQRGMARTWLMPIVDHTSKLVVGHAVGERADTELAVTAWAACTEMLKDFGIALHDITIHHDQDGVYLGYGWLNQVVVKSRARVSYSLNGAKGNVHMESFNGRFKEENRLIFWEHESFRSLQHVVDERIRYYNDERRHSTLGNKSPMSYLKEEGFLVRSTDSGI
jgi:putative transposase